MGSGRFSASDCVTRHYIIITGGYFVLAILVKTKKIRWKWCPIKER